MIFKTHGRALPLGSGALALALCTASVFAQTQSTASDEAQRVKEAAAQPQAAGATAQIASDADTSGEDVTFEQVLDNPDDIDLNYRFAKAEVRRGNLRSAIGTLERILILAPGRVDVRVMYAVVLFRSNSLIQARDGFQTLAKLNLPPDLQDTVRRYLREIELRGKPTRYYVQASLGLQTDTNRTSGPDGDIIQIGGTNLNINGTAASRKEDYAGTASVVGGFTHRLGNAQGDKIFGQAGVYHGEQASLDSFDVSLLFGEFGRDFNTSYGKWTVKGFGSTTRLSHENFLNSIGGEIRFDHKVDSQIRLYESFRTEHQNFQPIGENLAADNEDGLLHNATFGMHYKMRPDLLVDAHVRVNWKNARQQFDSYAGREAGATVTWLMGEGTFSQFTGNWRVDEYKAPNAFVNANRSRSDRKLHLRASMGTPLANILGKDNVPYYLTDSLMSFGLDYRNSASSLPNYDYYNVQFSAVLTKRWDF